jgi:hypothetical protein
LNSLPGLGVKMMPLSRQECAAAGNRAGWSIVELDPYLTKQQTCNDDLHSPSSRF